MKKPIKIILWILAVLIFLFIVIVSFVPTWVSSTSGQKTVLRWINKSIDGHLTVENVQVSWLGKQRLEKLVLKDAKEQVIFSFNAFETDTTLLYLMLGGRSLNRTALQQPYFLIEHEVTKAKPKVEVEEKVKIERPKRKKRKTHFVIPSFAGEFFLHDGTVIFSSDTMSPITISEIQIEKQLKPDLLLIRAETEQGNVQGSVLFNAHFLEKFQATAQIKAFPIAIFDELADSSIFTEALGSTLNADLSIEKNREESLNIKGMIKSDNLSAYVEGVTEQERFELSPQTSLEFTVTPSFFKNLVDEKQRADWELASKTKLQIQVEKGVFPLTLKKPDFHDIVLQAKATIDRAELNHKKLGSYSLNHFEASIIALENLEIDYKGEIQGKEATKLSGKLSVTPDYEVLFYYDYKGFPVSLLELVSPQLEKNVRFLFGHQFDMQSSGTLIDGHVDSQLTLSSRDTLIEGNLKGSLPELNFGLTGSRKVIGNKAKVLGEVVYFSLDGNLNLSENSISIPFVKGRVFNPHFEIDLRGQIGEKGEQLSPEHVQVIATGFIKNLPLDVDSFKDGSLYVQVDGSKNLIIAQAETKTSKASCEVHNFIQDGEFSLDKADTTFSCDLNKFPVAAIGPFISEDLDLTVLLGPTISAKAHGSYLPQEDPQFSINLNATATGFKAQISLAIDGTLIVKQNKPSSIQWEMTPERYTALMRMFRLSEEYEPSFTLTRSTKVNLQISQFICPTDSPKDLSHFLCQGGFNGDLHIGTTTFRNMQTNESIVFQEITGSIEGENFSQAIDLTLSGNILAANVPQSEQSSFSFEGQMLNFWTPTGKFNREKLTLKGILSLDLIPVRQLTGIAPIDQETRAIVQAVLGELVNARIYGEISQLSGPVTIDIKSSNFKANLSLLLQPNAIYLREFVDAEITLTEAVNTTLLTDIAPLFITGAYSEHPLKIYIEPQGFVIPIRPYSLQGVQIGKAIIDIGKISVRNGGQIQKLMDFLKATNITPDGWMSAWFTPIFMHLEGGVATYKRFDALLANSVHIALWGSINLINDDVRMTLAIAPSTLQQKLGVSGLTKKDMFQVKMRGKTHKLELDWSAASTRIAFIIARTAGGHIGYLVGGILEQLVKSLGEEPSPPPTTDPLPWESQYPSEPGQSIPKEASPNKSKKGKGWKKAVEFLVP